MTKRLETTTPGIEVLRLLRERGLYDLLDYSDDDLYELADAGSIELEVIAVLSSHIENSAPVSWDSKVELVRLVDGAMLRIDSDDSDTVCRVVERADDLVEDVAAFVESASAQATALRCLSPLPGLSTTVKDELAGCEIECPRFDCALSQRDARRLRARLVRDQTWARADHALSNPESAAGTAVYKLLEDLQIIEKTYADVDHLLEQIAHGTFDERSDI